MMVVLDGLVVGEFVLWIVADLCMFFYFVIFLLKSRNLERQTRTFYLSVSFLFLLFGLQRLFSIIFDFFYKESIFLFLINLFLMTASIPLLLHLENNTIKSKRVLSYSTLFMVLIYIIASILTGYDRVLIYYFIVPPFALSLGSIVSIYLYLMIKGTGNVRKTAIIIECGIVLITIFWFLHGQLGRGSVYPDPNLIDIIGIICPTGYIFGLLILAYGFFLRKE